MRAFPLWTRTLAAMIAGNCQVRVNCTECGQWRQVDLAALAERVGPDYSLVDRRCRCRLSAGCKGWNRFYFQMAVYRPLWTDARAREWMLEG